MKVNGNRAQLLERFCEEIRKEAQGNWAIAAAFALTKIVAAQSDGNHELAEVWQEAGFIVTGELGK